MTDRFERLAWFKATILPHEASLRRHLRGGGAHASEIDDLVAEALARAYQVADWSRIDRGRSYLFSIARNLLMDAARRNKVVAFETFADLEVLNLVDYRASVEAAVIAWEELRHLQGAVDRLPARAREVLLLRRVEGLTSNEVAERLSLSVSTVEKHFSRAMALLTKSMAEHDPVEARTERTWRNVRKTR